MSFLGSAKQRDDVGYDLAVHYVACAEHTALMLEGVTPMVDTGMTEDADVVVVAFGTPGGLRAGRRAIVTQRGGVRRAGARPMTLVPFPSGCACRRVHGAKAVAVYENNTGQMVDDVRLAVLGDAPVEFIGGMSLDSSGFGIAPDLDVAVLRRRILDVVERHQ